LQRCTSEISDYTQRQNLQNYRNYYRQYAGFYNDKGEKCIVINYTTHKQMWIEAANKRWIYVLDGGNHFWQAAVNLGQRTLLAISINGEA